MRKPISLSILVGVALLLATTAFAQEPEAVVQEEVQVTEVLLDVVVEDQRGHVVLGLGKDDFIVEEDGKRMELNDVSFYSHRRFLESSRRAEELGIDPDAVPVERLFILFFHDQRRLLPRLGARQLEAGRRARQWVRTDLESTDLVAVVAYDTSIKILQDFTNDQQQLEKAISRAVQGLDPVTEVAVRQPQAAPSLLSHFAGDPARIYGALEVVGNATAHIPGRKNLAFFSIGFGEVDPYGFYVPDLRYYPDMVKVLNDANIAVYPIDMIPGAQFSLANSLDNSLSNLAGDTGGSFYFNFVNFLTPLEQMASDTNGYYLLSYTSRQTDGSGYQEVTVDTVNPEFEVRAREGYLYGDETE